MQTDLRGELLELEAKARAWFDPPDDELPAELERLDRAFAASSLLDLARPDGLNLALVRNLAHLSAEWDDAHVFAGVALVALQVAGDDVDDEAYALRYLGAAGDALRLAELADASRVQKIAQTADAAYTKWERGRDKMLDVVRLWGELAAMKSAAKVEEIGKRLSLSPKRIEAHCTEARKQGMID